MTFTDEQIFPGVSLVFGSNAENTAQLKEIKKAILGIQSVQEVHLNEDDFPYKLTVVVSKITNVEDIQKKVISVGYHVIPQHTLDI